MEKNRQHLLQLFLCLVLCIATVDVFAMKKIMSLVKSFTGVNEQPIQQLKAVVPQRPANIKIIDNIDFNTGKAIKKINGKEPVYGPYKKRDFSILRYGAGQFEENKIDMTEMNDKDQDKIRIQKANRRVKAYINCLSSIINEEDEYKYKKIDTLMIESGFGDVNFSSSGADVLYQDFLACIYCTDLVIDPKMLVTVDDFIDIVILAQGRMCIGMSEDTTIFANQICLLLKRALLCNDTTFLEGFFKVTCRIGKVIPIGHFNSDMDVVMQNVLHLVMIDMFLSGDVPYATRKNKQVNPWPDDVIIRFARYFENLIGSTDGIGIRSTLFLGHINASGSMRHNPTETNPWPGHVRKIFSASFLQQALLNKDAAAVAWLVNCLVFNSADQNDCGHGMLRVILGGAAGPGLEYLKCISVDHEDNAAIADRWALVASTINKYDIPGELEITAAISLSDMLNEFFTSPENLELLPSKEARQQLRQKVEEEANPVMLTAKQGEYIELSMVRKKHVVAIACEITAKNVCDFINKIEKEFTPKNLESKQVNEAEKKEFY